MSRWIRLAVPTSATMLAVAGFAVRQILNVGIMPVASVGLGVPLTAFCILSPGSATRPPQVRHENKLSFSLQYCGPV